MSTEQPSDELENAINLVVEATNELENSNVIIAVSKIIFAARRVPELEKQLENLKSVVKNDCETEEEVKRLARPFLKPIQIDGDTYGIPNEADIVEALIKQLAEANAELEQIEAMDIHNIIADRDYCKSKLSEAKEQIRVLMGVKPTRQCPDCYGTR